MAGPPPSPPSPPWPPSPRARSRPSEPRVGPVRDWVSDVAHRRRLRSLRRSPRPTPSPSKELERVWILAQTRPGRRAGTAGRGRGEPAGRTGVSDTDWAAASPDARYPTTGVGRGGGLGLGGRQRFWARCWARWHVAPWAPCRPRETACWRCMEANHVAARYTMDGGRHGETSMGQRATMVQRTARTGAPRVAAAPARFIRWPCSSGATTASPRPAWTGWPPGASAGSCRGPG